MANTLQNSFEWIEQSRMGNREAFAKIVRQYQGMVSAVTLNVVGDYDQSEDLAQETFLTVWKKLPELREPEKIASWIYGIARRTALNWIEKQQRNPLRGAAELDGDTAVDPRLELEQARRKNEQSLELVWSTVKELPETFREPLLLYYRYSKSAAEIAVSMDLTEDAVNQRLSRGRKMLKAKVEKQVENALEATRPGEHFVVCVLAAIPVLATGQQALAAGSAGAAATQSASSGGAGSSLFVGITTFCWTLFCNLVPVLLVGIGTVLGIWNGIRNAPTLRARQWMLKVALWYFIAAHLLALTLLLAIAGHNDAVDPDHRMIPERVPLKNFCEGLFCFMMGAAPFAVVLISYCINRRWRRIVEEDTDLLSCSAVRHASMKPVLMLGVVVLIIFVATFFILYWVLQPPADFFFIPSTILLFGVSLFILAGRISRDEKSFTQSPPRLPNLLRILTAEEKAPKGFRNRINFWGDLTGIGWGMFIMQIGSVGWYFLHRGLPSMTLLSLPIGNGGYFLLSVSLLIYLIFVVFFAGIPRRRYWGMILLGTTMTFGNAFMIYYARLWRHVHSSEFAMVFGLNFWCMFCFVLVGVAGLLAFRKQKARARSVSE